MYMVGGLVAIVGIFIMSSSSEDPTSVTTEAVVPTRKVSKPMKDPVPMHVTFENPSNLDVFLFTEHGDELAELPPQGSQSLHTKSGMQFFFSKKGSDKAKDHVVIVDEHQSTYQFRATCKNIRDDCAGFKWSCNSDPGWMAVHCPMTCNVCHLQDQKVRCDRKRMNTSDVPAVQNDGIDELFKNLKTKYPEYGVEILSEDPWVATFDTFTTDEEIAAILETTEGDFERSTDQGSTDSDTGVQEMVTSSGRTSTNTWCRGTCENHPKVKGLMAKIADVLQVPVLNYENLQVLNYQLNQFYKTHHDANPTDHEASAGHRVYTLFLYFSDVEEGGETDFPDLVLPSGKKGLSVKPKKGKALLWPSLMNGDVTKIDYRTMHQAKPVIKGLKLAANVWAHQHDYQTPNVWGCTGSFNT